MTQVLEKPETIEELEARLANLKAQQREQQQKQREAYESLKSDVISRLCTKAISINKELAEFRKESFESMHTVYTMLQEYSSRHADGKGSFRIDNDEYRVIYKRQGRGTFDERSNQAEKHIIDFVNSHFKDEDNTRDLVMSLLERKKGELDVNLVQKLYAMEDRFDDENWKRGISLLKESYKYAHSKDYVAFEKRDENGQWQPINLHFSSL